MENKSVNDPYVKILLDRRAEIKTEINKLRNEYSAIGELIRRDYDHKHPFKIEGEDR